MLIIEMDSIHSVSGDNTMFYLSTVGYVLSNKQSVDSQSSGFAPIRQSEQRYKPAGSIRHSASGS